MKNYYLKKYYEVQMLSFSFVTMDRTWTPVYKTEIPPTDRVMKTIVEYLREERGLKLEPGTKFKVTEIWEVI